MPVFIPKTKAKGKSKGDEVIMKSLPAQIMTEKEVRDMVDTVCRKKEGNVNVTVREEELKMILKRIGSSWAAFRAFRCLQYADTNKDGQISGAEIDKLVAYILKWQATKLNKY